MKISIQPSTIETTEDDPFKNDLLDREPIANALTNLVGSINGSAVLSIDGTWGSGKTTFLEMWQQLLQNKKFPVISFNAWETDFSNDPLVALSSELESGLKQYVPSGQLDKLMEKTRALAGKLARSTLPGLIRIVTAGVLNVDSLLEKELGNALASLAAERFQQYEESKISIEEFKDALNATVEGLCSSDTRLPLIIMIDELDRCRPLYAVELLEMAKHVFSVPGVIFILGVNSHQLAHSVCALYGSNFDGKAYLERFINIDVRLPVVSRSQLVESTLRSLEIDTKEELVPFSTASHFKTNMSETFAAFFDFAELDYRTVDQVLRRTRLAIGSLNTNARLERVLLVVLQIMRAIDFNLYRRFCEAEVEDHQVIAEVFSRRGGRKLIRSDSGGIFNCVIMLGAWVFQSRSSNFDQTHFYARIKVNSEKKQIYTGDDERRSAEQLVDLMDPTKSLNTMNFLFHLYDKKKISFKSVVDLIEMYQIDPDPTELRDT